MRFAVVLVALLLSAGALPGSDAEEYSVSRAPNSAETVQQTVDLGSAQNFAALAGGALSSAGISELAGGVGVSPGAALSGFPPGTFSGTAHIADAVAGQAHDDLALAYADAAGREPTDLIAGDLAGRTLMPGIYNAVAALSLSSALTLDGGGNADGVFVFQVSAAFNSAASSLMTLVNGAQADHVFWQVLGAVTLGAGSIFVGVILAMEAVTVGASVSIVGRVLSINGSVSLSSNDINPLSMVGLGTAADYSALAATAILNSGLSTFSANIGVSPDSLVQGFPPGIVAGEVHAGDAEANQAQVDLRRAYADAAVRSATGGVPASASQSRFVGGVYRSTGSVSLGSSLTFDGQNNANSIFIVQINGDFAVGAASRIVLINRADPGRIFWQVTGTTTLGSNSTFVGTVLSEGSIVMRSGVQLTGRVLSLSGSITLTAAAMSTLTPVLLASAEEYSVLAATSVSNVGPTIINLNVGVSPGTTINGFPPGQTTGGSLHRADEHAGLARADAYAAYSDAASRSVTQSVSGDLNGMTLRSGVYGSAAALSLTGTLTLNGQNNPNAVFIIQVGAAFNTSAGSSIQLINGAEFSRVFWQVAGAASLGASSQFVGTIVSSGAITVGDSMILTGRVISLDGAVATSTNNVASPVAEAGTLSMTSTETTLTAIVLNGTGTQSSTGTSEGWSVSDQRGSGGNWVLTVSATDLVSAAGTVDTTARSIGAGSVSVTPGEVTALDGSAPPGALLSYPIVLGAEPQVLLRAPGLGQGTYLFSPSFVLTVPAAAFRSNFSGALNSSPLNPYVTVLTITIA